MSQPSILLSFLIAGLISSIWCVFFAEKKTHVALYLLGGIGGFFGGLEIGKLIGLNLIYIGEVNIVFGGLGALVVFFVFRLVIQSAN